MSQVFPGFHDGKLTGIQAEDGHARISLRQLNGVNYELLLEGVELLHMEDFRQGNIISRLEIITAEEPDHSWFLDRLFQGALRSATDSYYEVEVKQRAACVAAIASGETKLVEIRSSYGADLVALCRKATFREIGSKVGEKRILS